MNISQVAKYFDMTSSTLRYYEEIGLIPPVQRNASGIRNYNEEDLKWIDFIRCMRNAGLSIESLIEYTTLYMEGEHTVQKRKQILIDERARLVEKKKEMEETINRLDGKISNYEDKLLKSEAQLKSRV